MRTHRLQFNVPLINVAEPPNDFSNPDVIENIGDIYLSTYAISCMSSNFWQSYDDPKKAKEYANKGCHLAELLLNEMGSYGGVKNLHRVVDLWHDLHPLVRLDMIRKV